MSINRLMLALTVAGIALINIGCSSGGDAPSSTDPNTVFQMRTAGDFVPGYTETTNYTGSDTVGGTFTAVFSQQTLEESTFLGVPAIPVLGQLQLTSTSDGGFVSVIVTGYYSTSIDDLHYLGSTSSTTSTVSSNTEALPLTAKIGDFGVVGTYTDNAGNTSVQSWRVDDGSNGNADVVVLSTETDQFGNFVSSSVTTTKIDVNGNTLSSTIVLFFADSGITLTLTSR